MSEIEVLARKIRDAHSIVVLTGAGASAESGVPTFRGPGGLWKNYRAEDLATPQAFDRDPALVWEWYHMRRAKVMAVEPNAGHFALARLQKAGYPLRVVTQNVDRLHQRAGASDVVELHGNILDAHCQTCTRTALHGSYPEIGVPRCPHCGGRLRPSVVWFGEALDPVVLDRAATLAQGAGVFLTVGTSSVVQPAASLAGLAKRNDAYVVEINPDATPASELCDAVFRSGSADVLERLAGHVLAA